MNNNNPFNPRYHREMKNGNPFSQFKSMTPQGLQQMNQFGGDPRLHASFQPNQVVLDKINYQNQGEVLHNNLNDHLLSQNLTEYRLFIDSGDRDESIQSDPFSYKVYLKPDGPSHLFDAKTGETSTIPGTPRPHLPFDFKNIKYLRVDNVILPVYSKYERVELVEADIADWVDYYNEVEDAVSYFRITDGAGNLITGDNDGVGVSIDDIINDDDDFTPVDENNITNAERLTYLQTRMVTSAQLEHRALDADPLADRTQITRMYNSLLDYDYYFEPADNKWYIYIKDRSDASKLYDDKYLILEIDELKTNQMVGTNKFVGDSFGLCYPDRQFSDSFYQASSYQSSLSVDTSELFNLNKLTIRFRYQDGTQIAFDHLSTEAYSVKDPRHTLHKHLQNQISIVVGVVEAKLNREVQFSR